MAIRPQAGASAHQITLKKRSEAWLAHHQLVAVETLLRMLRNPLASILTWMVIAIALTLPGVLWMSLDNMQQLSGSFQESGRVTLYLKKGTTDTQGQQLTSKLRKHSLVNSAEYIDAERSLADFRQYSGLDAALEFLGENPLPSIILVEPPLGINQAQTTQLLEMLQQEYEVESVQVDMAWVERLYGLLSLTERIVWVLGLLLALAIVLVVGNTIRLDIAARVDEIRVIKLVGGTNAWVRRPFLYTGLWYGIIGGILAWLFLIACWLMLRGAVADLAALYGSAFTLKPLSADAAMFLLGGAMLLGWLGAWWSVSRHLHQIEP